MRRILILRGGALGDFIVTLPALAALRAALPTARIELAGNAPAAALAVTRGLLDDAHSQHESRWAALYDSAPLPSDFAAWLAPFDLILNFWPDPDGDLVRRLPLHPAQRFLTAPAHPTITPAAAHYCAPLAQLGLAATDHLYPLKTSEVGRVFPNPPPSPIALHPGSGSPQKIGRSLAGSNSPRGSAPLTPPTSSSSPAKPSRPPVAPPSLPSAQWPTRSHSKPSSRTSRPAASSSATTPASATSPPPAASRASCSSAPPDPVMWAPPAPHVQVLRHAPTLDTLPLSAVQTALTLSHFAD